MKAAQQSSATHTQFPSFRTFPNTPRNRVYSRLLLYSDLWNSKQDPIFCEKNKLDLVRNGTLELPDPEYSSLKFIF